MNITFCLHGGVYHVESVFPGGVGRFVDSPGWGKDHSGRSANCSADCTRRRGSGKHTATSYRTCSSGGPRFSAREAISWAVVFPLQGEVPGMHDRRPGHGLWHLSQRMGISVWIVLRLL